MCKCVNGFKGKRCEVSKCKNYCLNSGTCTIDSTNGKPICNCNSGFIGKKCQQPLDCSNLVCLNNAECIKNSPNGVPSCKCLHKTYGEKCQYCNECENNSTCQLIFDKSNQVSDLSCFANSVK